MDSSFSYSGGSLFLHVLISVFRSFCRSLFIDVSLPFGICDFSYLFISIGMSSCIYLVSLLYIPCVLSFVMYCLVRYFLMYIYIYIYAYLCVLVFMSVVCL